MRYSMLVEKVRDEYQAYSPELPGYGASGKTPMEAIQKLQKSLELHLSKQGGKDSYSSNDK